MSGLGGEADEISTKADIGARMSGLGGEAEVDFRWLDVSS
jgi:hypothetical protein